jgi:hypothetical protein
MLDRRALWKTVAVANPGHVAMVLPDARFASFRSSLPGYPPARASGRCCEYDSTSDSWPRTYAMSTVLLVDADNATKGLVRDIHRPCRASIDGRSETTDALSIQATAGTSGAYDEMTEARESRLLTERSGNHGQRGH